MANEKASLPASADAMHDIISVRVFESPVFLDARPIEELLFVKACQGCRHASACVCTAVFQSQLSHHMEWPGDLATPSFSVQNVVLDSASVGLET